MTDFQRPTAESLVFKCTLCGHEEDLGPFEPPLTDANCEEDALVDFMAEAMLTVQRMPCPNCGVLGGDKRVKP